MTFYRGSPRVHDCALHGAHSGAELYIVEGDSAATAVCAVRDPHSQAVLAMQGKPLNAVKASRAAVQANELYCTALTTLGFQLSQPIIPDQCRFERVVLLFDPDADGIHCGALMMMFFYEILRPLLESGRVYHVRAPWFEIQLEHANGIEKQRHYAYSEEQAIKLIADLELLRIKVHRTRYRGLGNIRPDTLRATCLSPQSRNLSRLRAEDAEAAIAVFGGTSRFD